jgi:putative multicomponent Na+:H+ antiporter subunit B
MVNLSDSVYIVAITALLPLTATMVVTQKNPYHALVIRGILGAVAALVYALFGAADVALTEALVGTMLSITLYAIAVRSSMSLRLGVLVLEGDPDPNLLTTADALPAPLSDALRQGLKTVHLRLEQVPYTNAAAMQQALAEEQIHGLYIPATEQDTALVVLRVRRLYDLMRGTVPPEQAHLQYCVDPVSPALEQMLTGAIAHSLEVTP